MVSCTYSYEKEYEVHVDGHPKDDQLRFWGRGVVLDGEWTSPAKVKVIMGASGTWLRVTMREGRKHQIRRTAEALGLWLKRLIRVRIGPLRTRDLKVGEWRTLRPEEVTQLKKPTCTEGTNVPLAADSDNLSP